MVANIQSILVPRRPSSKYLAGAVEISHLWLPLDEIGGDFLYYERIDEQLVSIEIGDVMGHGARAGLVMTALHGLLFGFRQGAAPLDQMLSNANKFLCRLQQLDISRNPDQPIRPLLCSMFLLRVDFAHHAITYCNAGHPPPMYLPHDADAEILMLKSDGPILGAFESATYHATTLRPSPGDTLLMYTDGISEATNASGEEFGAGRLRAFLEETHSSTPREIIQKLESVVASFRGDAATSDDVSAAVMQFGKAW